MEIDPSNPVVALCARGMEAEGRRRVDEARELFEEAWRMRRDDYDASIAAHYLARVQEQPEDVLAWNQRALDHARAAPPEKVATFFPSLYLNLCWSHEVLGDLDAAKQALAEGERSSISLPDTPYSAMVLDGLARARQRLETAG